MSGFTQVNYWLAETVSDTMLSGGCSWVDADKLDRRTVSPLWETDEQYIDILLGPERTRECFLEGSNDNTGMWVIPRSCIDFGQCFLRLVLTGVLGLCVV